MRTVKKNEPCWQNATDVDVFMWLRRLHSHGDGTTTMHITCFQGVGSDSGAQGRPSGQCEKRYAAASLDKGHTSQLKVL